MFIIGNLPQNFDKQFCETAAPRIKEILGSSSHSANIDSHNMYM